jgi:hypothetical protein
MAWHILDTYNESVDFYSLFEHMRHNHPSYILWKQNGMRHFEKQNALQVFTLYGMLSKFTRQNMRKSLWTYDTMNEIGVKLAFAIRLTIKVSLTSCCWTQLMPSSLAQLEITIPFLNQVLPFYFLKHICTHTICKWSKWIKLKFMAINCFEWFKLNLTTCYFVQLILFLSN